MVFRPIGLVALEVLAATGVAAPAVASGEGDRADDCGPENNGEGRRQKDRPAQQRVALYGLKLVRARQHGLPRKL